MERRDLTFRVFVSSIPPSRDGRKAEPFGFAQSRRDVLQREAFSKPQHICQKNGCPYQASALRHGTGSRQG